VGQLGRFFGAPRANCVRGFTLLEILVVVAIIAIGAGVAVLASTSDDRGVATREAKRLAGAVEHASARAQWRSETLGVSADGSGWRFWRRSSETNRWVPITDDDVLVAHAVPEGITVIPLSFAGQALPSDAIVPLRASGHNEPFAFVVRSQASRIVLAADPLNRVSWQDVADAP
jgi:type II secretion system protein H